MRIYVGNLSFDVTKNVISAEFALYGKVDSVVVASDRLSGHSKGYAFVEMSSNSEAEAAIKWLNGKTLDNRALVISEARPREGRGGSSNSNRRRVGYGSGGNYSSGKQRRYLPI
jgi:RNA recognition motif-containing protein